MSAALGSPLKIPSTFGQDNQRVAVHHGCNQPRQLVIVGKHQLCDAYCIVFIHDGYDAIVEHYAHTGALVQVFTTGGKALFHGENLPDVHAILAEKIVVEAHKFDLSQRREELPLRYTVELTVDMKLSPPACHRA